MCYFAPVSYKHRKLAEKIAKLDAVPKGAGEYSQCLSAAAHLSFLRDNALADKVVVFASREYTFVHSVVVRNAHLSAVDRKDSHGLEK